ncbi:MAG: hypothetical protein ACXWT1_10140 [Methylobacter sp.]
MKAPKATYRFMKTSFDFVLTSHPHAFTINLCCTIFTDVTQTPGGIMSAMHFYTTSENEPASGYVSEGITGYVFSQPIEGAIPFYRWRHPISNLHFYTVDVSGEAAPALGYVMEKIECYVSTPETLGTAPLYRWYNAETGDHLLTLDEGGELGPGSGYVSEGVACYLFSHESANTVPLYRWASGDQTYCIRLTRGGMVVFEKNVHVATEQEAKALADRALAEFNSIHSPGADRAEPPRLGGC